MFRNILQTLIMRQLRSQDERNKRKRPSTTSNRPLISKSSDDLVADMLNRYCERTAEAEAKYNAFVTAYMDWQDYSRPLIKLLEKRRSSRSSRGVADRDLSQIWEQCLTVHRPKLEKFEKELVAASESRKKGLGTEFRDGDRAGVDGGLQESCEHGHEAEEWMSVSTSPEKEI